MKYLLENIPALVHRHRTLAAIEPWVEASQAPLDYAEGQNFELMDFLSRELSSADSLTNGYVNYGLNMFNV